MNDNLYQITLIEIQFKNVFTHLIFISQYIKFLYKLKCQCVKKRKNQNVMLRLL